MLPNAGLERLLEVYDVSLFWKCSPVRLAFGDVVLKFRRCQI
jgi:hypothetical protein